ncbi:MAG: PBP1A family penicillin-binding protein [Rubrivivax sp.]|nr:PBP1A family penicillin-binding protein [Rubrivivax sp.]
MIASRLRAWWPPQRRGLLLALLGFLVTVVVACGAALAWFWSDLPPLDKATDYRPRQHLQVLTADGVEIAQFGSERRLFVPIAQTPKTLQQAVLAVEDADFYEHGAISWRGVLRAAVSHVRGGVGGGGSTITQQVSRTFFLSTRRTAERKIKEALIAWQLEHELSKDQILELYLNQIYLGQRAYGYGAGAQVYFNKTLQQLNLAETAMLAGLQNNPIYANPLANEAAAVKRQQWVLQRMLRTGVIKQAEHDAALVTPLVYRKPDFVDVHAQHVAEMARRAVVERLGDKAYTDGIKVITTLKAEDQRAAHTAVRRALMAHERRQPWRGPEDQETLPAEAASTGGASAAATAAGAAAAAAAERAIAAALKDARDDDDLRVAIVLNASPKELTAKLASGDTVVLKADALRWVQAALSPKANERIALRRGSVVRLVEVPRGKSSDKRSDKGSDKGSDWQLAQWPQAEGAFVALDPATGRVRALVGGFAFARQQFNRATSAQRQPGSAIKPFLYSAALEHGLMPETRIDDLPLLTADGGVPGWNPKNSDNQFDGEITLREGLVRSKNLVSIRLLQHLALASAREWIGRFGFDMTKQPQDLTLALGTGSTTPMQLAAAYAVLANGGHRVEPVLIERIVGPQGQILFEAPAPPPLDEATRAVPERNVYLVNTLLRDVALRGTAARLQTQLKRPDLYGKTGTTNDAVDAWFAGFTTGVVAVAWVGHDEPKSLGDRESGGGLALPIWADAVGRMVKGVKPAPMAMPGGLVAVGEDWRYAEWADGSFVQRIGEPPLPVAPAGSEPALTGSTAEPVPVPAPLPSSVRVPAPAPGPAPGPIPAPAAAASR